MTACCSNNCEPFDGASPAYRRVLWIVIALNAGMFLTETVAGHFAASQALKADALDFLADAATYGLSLAVIGRPLIWRSRAALLKGASLALMAVWVLGSTAWQLLVLGQPEAHVMGAIGLLALAVNMTAVLLLLRWREGDANVRSVWLCSRNDAIGNVAVMLAALGVWGTGTGWPDLIVAAIMAGLFLVSSVKILRQAMAESASLAAPHPRAL
ncbi:MAG: cation transporter [Alphaproteobacteria bacterium]